MLRIEGRTQSTLLANSWVVAHLPHTKYIGVLCCAGSAGEAAFRNSLDDAFAAVGYEHLLGAANRRRPPTYHVVGTTAGELTPTQRILRTANPFDETHPFHHAQVFSNTNDLRLNAVTLDCSQMSNLRMLPDGFMRGCTNLTSITLPSNVEEFGADVLSNCVCLTTLDMSGLLAVRRVPDHFLRGCCSLTHVKLPPNVEEVGRAFLVSSTNLTTMDMSSMVRMKKLSDRFMVGCTSLTDVTLPPNVDVIGRAFMANCSSLTTIQLPPNVQEVGPSFMIGCTSLTTIDMGSLLGVTRLPDKYMRGCTSLTSVKLPPNVSEIGATFMAGCTSLVEIYTAPS